ncbi:hypothetical protein LF845_00790 [Deferribacterales bacterium Es71-Z0220]|jgi:glycerophosphoryl diester phosphodiesterase|uniref:glycerophosphodiester phosphodiesterase n=1 Tax=Deferrivibrio essentukiensis TaxID=2880922 RepID=UPI001F60E75F|nr:glycerophosphodiester phosphodiesterase family protein [Deferrivibrio essentukiensis]MCB4203491.1 hypothetical protein [Deferrivibrio essentukiensis]
MKIIAHRGASFYAPENTMSAFKLAMEYGVDGIEMDVHVTKDGKIVVIHDDTTGRTGTRNIKIKNSNLKTLDKVDVGNWFDAKYMGERIPHLEDVLEKIPSNFELYIEIKSNIKSVDNFVNFFTKYKEIHDRIVIIGFDYNVVKRLKLLLPNFTILWIVEYGYNVPKNKDMYSNVYKMILNAKLDGISTYADLTHCIKMAKEIKNHNWIWNVWTVDNPHLAKQLMNLGVTTLTTNRPDWIMKHLFA